jgi:hypothetical protein
MDRAAGSQRDPERSTTPQCRNVHSLNLFEKDGRHAPVSIGRQHQHSLPGHHHPLPTERRIARQVGRDTYKLMLGRQQKAVNPSDDVRWCWVKERRRHKDL